MKKHKLMVKHHLDTKLKYLCYTKKDDPYMYTGSGTYWKRHLNEHGENIITWVIDSFDTHNELKEAGIHYSDLYDVVDSNEWANLKREEGDGGGSGKIGRTWTVTDTSNFGHSNSWLNDDGSRSSDQSKRMISNNPMKDDSVVEKMKSTKIERGINCKGANNPAAFPVIMECSDGTCFIFPYSRMMCNIMGFNPAEVSTYLNSKEKQIKQAEMIEKCKAGKIRRTPSHRGYKLRKI